MSYEQFYASRERKYLGIRKLIVKLIESDNHTYLHTDDDNKAEHKFNPFNCIHCMIGAFYELRRQDSKIQDDELVADAMVCYMYEKNIKNKNIYNIDSKLIELLRNKTSIKDIPVNALNNLPNEKGCILTFNDIGINIIKEGNYLIIYSLHLNDTYDIDTIWLNKDKSIFQVSEECDKDRIRPFGINNKEWLLLIAKIILYITGEKDTVKEVHPGKKFHYKRPGENSICNIQNYSVGKRIHKIIERYEMEDSSTTHLSSNRIVKPHIRSAHYHLYWTGKGRTIPIIKFVLSCVVNGKNEDIELGLITDVK